MAAEELIRGLTKQTRDDHDVTDQEFLLGKQERRKLIQVWSFAVAHTWSLLPLAWTFASLQ
jgi:hypothetical protein